MMEIMMEILRSSWSTTRLRSIHTACSAATIGLAFNIFKWTFCGISGIYVCTDHLHLHKSIRMLGTATTATTQQQHVWPGPLMVSMDDRPKLGKTHQARYVSLLGPRASSNLVWWTCRSNITVIHHWVIGQLSPILMGHLFEFDVIKLDHFPQRKSKPLMGRMERIPKTTLNNYLQSVPVRATIKIVQLMEGRVPNETLPSYQQLCAQGTWANHLPRPMQKKSGHNRWL